jgi:hypothetical protein
LVFGTVGQVTGREMLAFQSMFASTPTAEAIAADPAGCPLPQDVFVLWAVGKYLTDTAANGSRGEKSDWTRAFARYVLRWPEEAAAEWFRDASTRLPSLVGTTEYRQWELTFRGN